MRLDFSPPSLLNSCERSPTWFPSFKNTIDEQPDVAAKSLQKQFERLLLQPLSQIDCSRTRGTPLVLVVDTLDECEREDLARV
jgi:hypothetical protein